MSLHTKNDQPAVIVEAENYKAYALPMAVYLHEYGVNPGSSANALQHGSPSYLKHANDVRRVASLIQLKSMTGSDENLTGTNEQIDSAKPVNFS